MSRTTSNRSLGLWSSALLLWPVVASQADAMTSESKGLDVASLVAMQEQSVGDLVARHTKREVAPRRVAQLGGEPVRRVVAERSLSELMAGEVELGSLLRAPPAPVNTIATTLPKTTKVEQRRGKALAVQVVIPEGPIEDVGVEARLVTPDAKPASQPEVDGVATKTVGNDIVVSVARPVASKAGAVAAPELAVPVPTASAPTASALTAPTVPMQAATGDHQIAIVESPQGLAFMPQTLLLPKAGTRASIKIMVAGAQNLQIFVRDAQVLSWDVATQNVTALRGGNTELYVVHGGKMYILPVVVDKASDPIDLQVPGSLISLEGVLPGKATSSALYPGLDAELPATPAVADPAAPSLSDSLADTTRTLDEAEREYRRFAASSEQPSYGSLTLQVIDERSAPQAGTIYPAAGVNVHIVGTEFVARTDQTGHLTIRDVPLQSRFWVALSDPAGHLTPGIAELSTRDGKQGVVRVRGMRAFALETFGSIAGVAPNANYASLCGTVAEKADGGNVAGIAVSLDTPANGPYYFNQFGLLDGAQRVTGSDGRFCFLNVPPGPISIGLFDDDAPVAAVPTAVFAGRHSEVDLALGSERVLETRLAMMPTAHEQLGADLRAANSLKTIDMIDLIPLGDDTPMMQLGPGLVATSDPILALGDRAWTFAQAAEFEPVIYSHGLDRRDHVTPLLPRGFIDDMSLYAQVAHDPALGAVVIEYGGRERGDNGSVTFRLVDAYGQAVGEPWYYADQPTTKAIFFNVPAGAYAVLVETGDEYWLGGETILVYDETASYLRIGSRIRYRP
jgi:hypothetical protein